jgi:catechol 2,3-dioxygenase
VSVPAIVRLGHVVLEVRDLGAARAFYVDLLGLDVVEETADRLCVRGMEDREWTLMLLRGPAPLVREIGYKVAAEQVLDDLERLAAGTGLRARRASSVDRPSMLRLQDPFGLPLAFYFASVKHPWLLQQYDRHAVAAVQRIDHVNVFVPNPGQALVWYRDTLGFRLSEITEDDDGRVWAAWLQRKGHVHDLALTSGEGPRLHHLAFFVPEASRLLQLCDAIGARRLDAIERGPGRHGISNACFLYLLDPDGHRVELYTSDYLTVDPDFEPIRWRLDDPYRQQLWGGLAPRSWFLEGSHVASFDGGVQPTMPPELGLPGYIS